MIFFILGGVKSGKSNFAESIVRKYKEEKKYKKVFYIATYKDFGEDEEMKKKIENHKKRRDKEWKLIEISSVDKIIENMKEISNSIIIIECITTLVAYELLYENKEKEKIIKNFDELVNIMKKDNLFVVVSNEVGTGIIPENKLSRNYCEILGIVNQKIAANSDVVYFMVAGIPIKIK